MDNYDCVKIIVYGFLYFILLIPTIIFATRIAWDYFLHSPESWNILPGLNSLYLPIFGFFIHLIGGFTILFIGLIQVFPISRYKMIVHRVLGTIYCVSCLLAGIGGNIFIYTHGCVGGANMDIAFSFYGWLLVILAIITYTLARLKMREYHKRVAIILWASGLGSLFYRITYFVLYFVFGYVAGQNFQKPIDQIVDWWFGLVPLILGISYVCVRERYIRYKHKEPDYLDDFIDNSAINDDKLTISCNYQQLLAINHDEH